MYEHVFIYVYVYVDFQNMIEDFQAEEFLSKSLQQLYTQDIARPPGKHEESNPPAIRNTKKNKPPVVKIPKFLQNTPYFAAFSKLTENYEIADIKKDRPKESELKKVVEKPMSAKIKKRYEEVPKISIQEDYRFSSAEDKDKRFVYIHTYIHTYACLYVWYIYYLYPSILK